MRGYIHKLLFLLLFGGQAYGQILSSSDLPIVMIDTKGATIVDEPKIIASLTIIDNGTGKRNQVTDPATFTSVIGIELRGATSRTLFPKKPYGIELRDAKGVNSVNAPILGMPAESDWVMNAVYNDKTLLRDVLTYQIFRESSRYYASRYRFCEVILNGQYQGIYVIMEKIKRDKNRVDIANLKPEDVSGDQLTGGYILKIDKTEGSASKSWLSSYRSSSNKAITVQIDRPKIEDIQEAQFQYIRKYVMDFEDALKGASFSDSLNGFRKFADERSFVDYLLLTEVCKNLDGYRLSTFFYKDRDSKGGKLTMGPIWDYNLTYGNADYCDGNSYIGWAFNFNRTCPTDGYSIPFWWDRLLQDQKFALNVRLRYQELRKTVLSVNHLHAYIDSMATMLTEARARNFQKWPVLGVYVWPNGYVGRTYADEITYLKDWIRWRLDWLDSAIKPFGEPILAVEPALDESMELVAGPNPMAEYLLVRYTLTQRTDVQLQLTNSEGKIVQSLILPSQAAGAYEQRFDNDRLPSQSGVYLLSLTTGQGQRTTRKIIRY
ncbi:CotH kinase family protein [Arsenicibacter rosenii]|uniref:Spore coat protein CotH n=1 Tax=Arsenicibacter rosenii TaxID=1750698 RepID=A0A1S2VAP5_9BACT|nr:CotH kinase family protein [Arsenicibacter rosenii]OIN55804.1 spore coat protein CotH [Arsenicibacter rosenii]